MQLQAVQKATSMTGTCLINLVIPVPCHENNKNDRLYDLLISLRAFSSCFVILSAIFIWTIIESAILFLLRPSPPLVQKVPVETRKRPMLSTFVLKKQLALLHPELLQIPVMYKRVRLTS